MSTFVRILLLSFYGMEAKAALQFKNDAVLSVHWLPYAVVLSVLLLIAWGLAKYIKPKALVQQKGRILDTVTIHHKTKAYVLDYQGQHFLIAENPNAIAIQALKKGDL